ncbi:RimJ/RimL family protein N-acetyltransferase [Stackebrandtia endophytica]|uniref:RimJ/RimL family protein N-acetyltransferase n=1 Tax=Stackebrandtia endophytica TaxID=1496996 RepID=A0A543AT47_9ACTN|nr:GNAT family N-acetyltransferase [Stackebrandtia endophytica]TQL75753.1 RimJ/RimL family protein N-acetyltransferase [Stackebrandtia endophytica]
MTDKPGNDGPAAYPDRLTGEGFTLRPATLDDVDDMVAACNDPAIGEHLHGVPRPYTAEDAREFILTTIPDKRRAGRPEWVIADTDTDRYLGSIGIAHAHPRLAGAELGYLVAPWARGRRLAARALTTVTGLLFQHGVERTELLISPRNVASQRAALRAGYQREGIRRGASRHRDGTRGDYIAYARLSTDPEGPVPRLLPDLPEEGLTDGVVRLRLPQPDDVDAKFALAILEEVWRHQVPPQPASRESIVDACHFGAAAAWLAGSSATMVIEDVETGRFLGNIALHVMAPELGEAMLSYGLTRQARGRGYTTRAVRLVCRWGFEVARFQRLTAGTAPGNIDSQRVLERAGFTREGLERSRLPGADGDRIDNILWSLLPKEMSWTS